jgi:hypothetical protein
MNSAPTPCFSCQVLREELAATRAALLELATRAPTVAAIVPAGHKQEAEVTEAVMKAVNRIASYGSPLRRELLDFAKQALADGIGEATVIGEIVNGSAAQLDSGDDE